MTHPLGSIPVTGLHRYYGVFRPCAPHRYSGSCGSTAWAAPFASGRQVPTFHERAWIRLTPPLCRMPRGPSAGFAHAYPERKTHPRFWHRL